MLRWLPCNPVYGFRVAATRRGDGIWCAVGVLDLPKQYFNARLQRSAALLDQMRAKHDQPV